MLDIDPALAAQTRRRLLDRASAERMLILGYHLPFPGLVAACPPTAPGAGYPAQWRGLP